jgi:PAS domain S-box-containing protein
MNLNTDLHEIMEWRAKYRGLLEDSPDAMVVVNPSGGIVLLKDQAEKLFGYLRDELPGQKVEDIIPQGLAERLIAEAMSQQTGNGIELNGRRKDGTEFPIEIVLNPLETARRHPGHARHSRNYRAQDSREAPCAG